MYVIQKGTEAAPVVVVENAEDALAAHPDLFVQVEELAGDVSGQLIFQKDPNAPEKPIKGKKR